ncbi:Armadillo-type fold domain containing protein [Cordyceps militaris CM01]|uniref:Armadillo-type fold domain containing protein n=1 Tax=Cordyceps militaris (strain CM01) TaxID=983644 RepID=G3J4V4_CORMM|nr:Armadillo-type fold domain containing protein [Cordyceps militaris CM01]EGX95921.1 Armadillo-type fold domain containing protein [Cordyceps militaris CM01]
MNHARVKALKGNKTVSRKAVKSGRASGAVTPQGTSSPMASLLTSPTHSTTHSRPASDSDSDDSDFELDDMMSSIHSADSLDAPADDGSTAGPALDTEALLQAIQDRKHNNTELREQYLDAFIRFMRTRYSEDTHLWLDTAATSLTDAFLKGANRGDSPRERLLSLQAYCITLGTVEDMEVYEGAARAVKQILLDDDDDSCRVWALYALAMSVLYGGGVEEAALETMEYFIDIVQSDGESIEAHDNAAIVSAALLSWGFVAAHVDDYSDYADAAIDAIIDQLDSGDVDVQSNAAMCIALIYESSRAYEAETGKPFQLQYDPQRLVGRIAELARMSAKSASRRSRRELRESLVSVVTALERGVGPYYSTALYMPEKDERVPASQRTEDGRAEYGYRLKLRLQNRAAKVDTWSLYFRVTVMKLLLRGGLDKHMFVNPVVSECLEDANFAQEYTPEDVKKARKK